MAERSASGVGGAPRKSMTSPLMLILLLVQSHLGFEVVVAAGRRRGYYYNGVNYDIGSRRTTTASSVRPTTPSAFVFRDCGEHGTGKNLVF